MEDKRRSRDIDEWTRCKQRTKTKRRTKEKFYFQARIDICHNQSYLLYNSSGSPYGTTLSHLPLHTIQRNIFFGKSFKFIKGIIQFFKSLLYFSLTLSIYYTIFKVLMIYALLANVF